MKASQPENKTENRVPEYQARVPRIFPSHFCTVRFDVGHGHGADLWTEPAGQVTCRRANSHLRSKLN